MGFYIKKVPGKDNLKDQYKKDLNVTRRHLKKLLKDGKGDYQFGALTAAYLGISPGTPDWIHWMSELQPYDQTAQMKIKNAVIEALTNHSPPLPIEFDWDPSGSPKDVIVTPGSSSYLIKIVGYPEPRKSRLAGRKKKLEKT